MIKSTRGFSSKQLGSLVPLIIGFLAFYLVVGPKALDPSNLWWINGIDPVQHYLGWAFYRFGPWTLPIGINPQFGLEISSSVVFSDSIPLVAILLKPFSAWLPDPFQYLGLWVFICLVLQGYFGFLLMSLMTQKLALKILGMGLMVFAPPMLLRIGLHAALVSHFLILAAFYLALSTRTPKHVWGWIILLLITAMIHVYLLLMVLFIWFGQLLDGLWSSKSLTLKQASVQTLLMFGLLGLCLWQVGYFALGFGSAVTFELYGGWGLNLASFIDPQGWSYLRNIWPNVTSNLESFFYFGLGIIFLALFFVISIPQSGTLLVNQIRLHRFLIVSLTVLMLFAITHKVVIGTLRFSYELPPDWIANYASIFRLSARLAWPIWYGIVLMFIYGVVRRFSDTQACVILGIALIVQVIDTSSGYLPMRERNQTSRGLNYENPSKSDFWEQAAKRYNNIRFFPLHTALPQPHWHVLSTYAAKHHLATNAVFLARLDQNKIATANRQFHQQLRNKNLDPHTLYVLDDAYIVNVHPFINRQKDYLAKIDGYLSVLALNYKTCADCPLDDSEKAVDALSIEPALGQRIAFTKTGIGKNMMGWGSWAERESWGMWVEDRIAVISLMLPKHAHEAVFEWNALVSQKYPVQRVKVRINDGFEQLFTLAQAHDNHTKLLFPPQLRGQYIQIEFNFLDAERSATLLGVTFY